MKPSFQSREASPRWPSPSRDVPSNESNRAPSRASFLKAFNSRVYKNIKNPPLIRPFMPFKPSLKPLDLSQAPSFEDRLTKDDLFWIVDRLDEGNRPRRVPNSDHSKDAAENLTPAYQEQSNTTEDTGSQLDCQEQSYTTEDTGSQSACQEQSYTTEDTGSQLAYQEQSDTTEDTGSQLAYQEQSDTTEDTESQCERGSVHSSAPNESHFPELEPEPSLEVILARMEMKDSENEVTSPSPEHRNSNPRLEGAVKVEHEELTVQEETADVSLRRSRNSF